MNALFKIFLLSATVLLGIIFTVQNPGKVTINYYFSSIEAPISLVISVSLLLGAILGWMIAWSRALGKQRRYRQMQKKLTAAEAEISNLRKLPIRDDD
ncbi:MAG TPA: LapA family protein [Chromatiales bacterium]|nr:LapA family protein [Thiotrichales bacterium]HIP67535.1 LapA family protein [Chromatiales bacterium]